MFSDVLLNAHRKLTSGGSASTSQWILTASCRAAPYNIFCDVLQTGAYWTLKWTELDSPSPSLLVAEQVYLPRFPLCTFWRTNDCPDTMTPAEVLVWTSFPSNHQRISETHGFALTLQSKYTSFPSWIWEWRNLDPNLRDSWGTSVHAKRDREMKRKMERKAWMNQVEDKWKERQRDRQDKWGGIRRKEPEDRKERENSSRYHVEEEGSVFSLSPLLTKFTKLEDDDLSSARLQSVWHRDTYLGHTFRTLHTTLTHKKHKRWRRMYHKRNHSREWRRQTEISVRKQGLPLNSVTPLHGRREWEKERETGKVRAARRNDQTLHWETQTVLLVQWKWKKTTQPLWDCKDEKTHKAFR